MTWKTMTTPERVTALGNLIAATPGASAGELGEKLGAGRNAILGFITRNEAKLPTWAGQPKPDPWTDEAVEALRIGYQSGRTIAEVAASIGVTRLAAIGKANRMGFEYPVKVQKRKPHGLTFGNPISAVPTMPKDVKPGAFDPLPNAPAPKKLWELERNECHWPVGEDPAVFCGCTADDGRYCKKHTKMSGKMVPRLVFA